MSVRTRLHAAKPRVLSLMITSILLAACTTSPTLSTTPLATTPESVAIEKTLVSADITEIALADVEPLIQTPVEAAPEAVNDVWERLRNNYSLPVLENARIQSEVDWFARHPTYMDRVNERAAPYMHYIVSEVEKRGMPGEIALLPIVESAFQPFAYSHGRAAGIWQFIPGTGRHYGLKQNWWYDGRRDVYASTQAALDYLQYLSNLFDGDWMLALAAYNSGEGTVQKAVRRNKKRGKPTHFWALNLPKETRSYVPKLLAIAKIVEKPEHYNMNVASLDNTPYFHRVDTKSQIDLALAAEMADISLDELYKLNPGFNRWATAPKGPHYLLIPVDKAPAFEAKLADLPSAERMRWKHHKVKSGETLSQIADKYRISLSLLKSNNKLRRNMIRVGQNLVIPVAAKSARTYRLSETQRKQKILNSPKSGRYKIIHTVKSGDNFWDISRKYKVSVRSLAKWNAMAPRDVLQRGQKLVVWTKVAHTASRSPTRQASVPRSKSIMQKVNYVVRRGDSLARIASRFRVSVSDLLRWNTIKKNKYLQPGQRIKLFVDVTSQSS